MKNTSLRLVLDTSVIVSAFRSRTGASNRVLQLLSSGYFTALATTALWLEYEAVLSRPEQQKAHRLTHHALQTILRKLAANIEPVPIYFQWRPQLNDPGDEMVLDAAVNGRADAIVTHNRAHFLPAARLFGTRIISPADVLPEIEV